MMQLQITNLFSWIQTAWEFLSKAGNFYCGSIGLIIFVVTVVLLFYIKKKKVKINSISLILLAKINRGVINYALFNIKTRKRGSTNDK